MKTIFLPLFTSLALASFSLSACGDSAESVDTASTAAGGAAGSAAGGAGSGGTVGGTGPGGAAGTGGAAGVAGTASPGGAGQTAGSSGQGSAGTAAGSVGSAGEGGASAGAAGSEPGLPGGSGQAGSAGSAGSAGTGGQAGAAQGASVAWQDKPTEPVTIKGDIALDWGFFFEVAFKDQPAGEWQLDLERCQHLAGESESCFSGGKQAAQEGKGAIKFGVDPGNYNQGENRYRMTLRLYQKDELVSADTLELVVIVTD